MRTYNSVVADRAGVFGPGWSSALDVVLDHDGDRIEVRLSDGAVITFVPSARADGGAPVGTVWQTDSRRSGRLETGRRRLQSSTSTTSAGSASTPTERLTGWEAGVAAVVVERQRRSHRPPDRAVLRRAITVDWDGDWDGDLVAGLVTSDGRSVTYQRRATGQLEHGVDPRRRPALLVGRQSACSSVTDNDGVAAFVNEYDDAGRVVRQTSPFGRITSYTYQVPGATVISDERGVRQAMVHDGRGNLTAVIDVDGSAMRITYDDADRAVRVVSKSGAEWRYDFDDGHRRPARAATIPTGSRSRGRGTSSGGRSPTPTAPALSPRSSTRAPTAHRSRVDRARRQHRDGRARRRRPARRGSPMPTASCGCSSWDRDGQLTAITDATGAMTTFEFDAAGLLVRLVDPAGVDTRLDYERGRVVAQRAWRRGVDLPAHAGRPHPRRDRAGRHCPGRRRSDRTARWRRSPTGSARPPATSTTRSATSRPSSPPTAPRTATSSTRSGA